jgi:hypothetical protein
MEQTKVTWMPDGDGRNHNDMREFLNGTSSKFYKLLFRLY